MSSIQLFDLNGEQRFTGTSVGGGGAQPFTVVRYAFAWDTPGIVSPGFVAIYTPSVGDLIVDSLLSVPAATPFNGTLPSLWLYSQNNPDPFNIGFIGGPFLTANTVLESGQVEQPAVAVSGNGLALLVNTQPLVVSLRKDDDGGDPGSTAGAGELVLVILKAT